MQNNVLSGQNIRVLIVDDEEEARNLLERLLLRLPDIVVTGKAASADEGIEMAISRCPDLVFLDVHMPEKNGFQLVDYFRKYLLNTCVIFVTAHTEFAINAMKVGAFDYLLKPVLMEELKETILRYKAIRIQKSGPEIPVVQKIASRACKLKFNTRTGYILIDPEEIMYCEADVNYTRIYLNSDTNEIVTVNLGRIEELLSAYPFYRISRSILINQLFLNKADRQKKQCVLMKGATRVILEISSNHIRELEKLLDGNRLGE